MLATPVTDMLAIMMYNWYAQLGVPSVRIATKFEMFSVISYYLASPSPLSSYIAISCMLQVSLKD